ncbi:hypothetical protein [Salinifilum ghardaiensis]
MRGNGTDADELTEYFNRGKIALDAFADDLDTVRAKMNQAREVAAQHGLNVTATTIEHPGQAPPKMPSTAPGPDTTERTPAEQQAIADYQAKIRAFNEAHATVQAARRKEDSAHDALQKALKMTKSLPEALVPQGWAWAPVVTVRTPALTGWPRSSTASLRPRSRTRRVPGLC